MNLKHTPHGIMESVKRHVQTYLPQGDTMPIIVGIADPKTCKIGISIQKDYPLTQIERNYGIPFGRFRNDAVDLLADVDELHGYKWSIETHEAVFEADARYEERANLGKSKQVRTVVSTGLGNLLQNTRSLAYYQRALHMVSGEQPFHPPPLACLVYRPGHSQRVGVELLLFNDIGGCHLVGKKSYFQDAVKATHEARQGAENDISWAVSGYPLIIAGQTVPLEMTAQSVSDYRHLWRLPKLEKALVKHLQSVCPDPNVGKKIEFYFGFEEIQEKQHFVRATKAGMKNEFTLDLALTQEWIDTVCSVCHIERKKFLGLPLFDTESNSFKLDAKEVAADFIATDYRQKSTPEEIHNLGDFCIDATNRKLVVKLLPAIYPHHIVGILPDGIVVNVSICGLSGRSGITIEAAQALCREIGLTDALIFDNGMDVFARLYGSETVCHDANKRQTRLTAALHFAYLLDPGHKAGIDFVTDFQTVTPTKPGIQK